MRIYPDPLGPVPYGPKDTYLHSTSPHIPRASIGKFEASIVALHVTRIDSEASPCFVRLCINADAGG